ncbi:MAG: hypothetical protein D6681_18215 [Calditrichaeota bacterium]|nr:MAG: hypothetical protein D6681_18215 [Calditrichota bacterium]
MVRSSDFATVCLRRLPSMGLLILCLLLITGWSCSQSDPVQPGPEPSDTTKYPYAAPAGSGYRWYFAQFLQQIDSLAGDTTAQMALTDSFMTYAAQFGFPLVEDSSAHFLYRGQPAFPFSVAGDFNGWQPGVDLFTRVGVTDLYYHSEVFPLDARLDYKFVLGGTQWILDPLNPHTVTGGFGPNSELAMPHYVQPWEINYDPTIPHGDVQHYTFHSTILNNNRSVWVYTPPGYQQDTLRYPSIYVQDGGEYMQLGSMVNVLDNLIAASMIEPVIAVFVNPVNRNQEYWLNADYARMLRDELVPFVEGSYRTRPAAAHRAVMGASLGGLISLYTAFLYPEVFGLAAGHSSALQVNNEALRQMYAGAPRKNIRIYLDWGTFESLQQANQRFVNVLQNKGYPFRHNIWHEGHSWGNWRAHIDEILIYFWEPGVTGIAP